MFMDPMPPFKSKEEIKQKILLLMSELTEEERKELIVDNFCRYCMQATKTACYCENDE